MKNRYKIVTFGCQMNLADSSLLASVMDANGYQKVEKESEADIIVLNTCSVRARAEERVFGRLGELSSLKNKNNGKIIAVVGCMAQRLGRDILNRAPYVDIILGPDRIYDLPKYLNNGVSQNIPAVHTEFGYESPEDVIPQRDSPYTAFITISRGCDNYCTYCIVPYVRGREISFPVPTIVRQVNKLVEDNVLEITLLGQNVNSYRDGNFDFSDLLKTIINETEIRRIRFMTSHPKDMSDRLIETIGQEKRMMAHVHLPLQSGSDRILTKMRRGYTYKHYLSLVGKLRDAAENISLTTDLIVGFPSETEDDFEKTIKAVEEITFDSAFMFRYSIREGTEAARLTDDVPESEKIRRLTRLIETQKKIAFKKNQKEIGRVSSVLIDGFSRRDINILKGKSEENKTVLIPGSEKRIGIIQDVKITSADSWTLHGEMVNK